MGFETDCPTIEKSRHDVIWLSHTKRSLIRYYRGAYLCSKSAILWKISTVLTNESFLLRTANILFAELCFYFLDDLCKAVRNQNNHRTAYGYCCDLHWARHGAPVSKCCSCHSGWCKYRVLILERTDYLKCQCWCAYCHWNLAKAGRS